MSGEGAASMTLPKNDDRHSSFCIALGCAATKCNRSQEGFHSSFVNPIESSQVDAVSTLYRIVALNRKSMTPPQAMTAARQSWYGGTVAGSARYANP